MSRLTSRCCRTPDLAALRGFLFAGDMEIAVLGTGLMGAPIAANLSAAGRQVRAWNRTRAKAEPLASRGVTVAGTPAAAVEGAEIVLTMLNDGPTVTAVVQEAAP